MWYSVQTCVYMLCRYGLCVLDVLQMGKRKGKEQKEASDEESKVKVQEAKTAQEVKEEVEVELQVAKKVSYCPICSYPFELCKEGRRAGECAAFLHSIAPAKVQKYHPNFDPTTVVAVEVETKQQSKALGQIIVIDVKERRKKSYVTTVSGLQHFNIDTKELAKKCSKKYALSCAATEVGVVQLQGDNEDNIRQLLIGEYKIKKKYILSKEEKKEMDAEKKQKLLEKSELANPLMQRIVQSDNESGSDDAQ